MSITFQDIKNNREVQTYLQKGNDALGVIGFTEHGFAHAGICAATAADILQTLGYDERTITLARIAGYMHDIGNVVNRIDHAQSGAVMAFRILDKLGMEAADIADIVTAIGNHDEGTGIPVNDVSAALFLADKSDVRRSRVRNIEMSKFDIHDRVNYSVFSSSLKINEEKTEVILDLGIDTSFSTVTDFFEIFLERMLLCRKAAEKLGLSFRLIINGQALM